MISAFERSNIVRTRLLPILIDVDKQSLATREDTTNRALREVAFDWAESLLYELKAEQTANERGSCLEGLAGVLERSVVDFTSATLRSLSRSRSITSRRLGVIICDTTMSNPY